MLVSGKDLLHNKILNVMEEEAIHNPIIAPELSKYFTEVLEGLSDVDSIRLASFIQESSS